MVLGWTGARRLAAHREPDRSLRADAVGPADRIERRDGAPVHRARGAGFLRGSREGRIATNLDPAESDLTPMDPRELVAAATGRAVSDTDQRAAAAATPQDTERRQG